MFTYVFSCGEKRGDTGKRGGGDETKRITDGDKVVYDATRHLKEGLLPSGNKPQTMIKVSKKDPLWQVNKQGMLLEQPAEFAIFGVSARNGRGDYVALPNGSSYKTP